MLAVIKRCEKYCRGRRWGGLSDGSISEIKQMGFKFQLIVSDKIQLIVILIFS